MVAWYSLLCKYALHISTARDFRQSTLWPRTKTRITQQRSAPSTTTTWDWPCLRFQCAGRRTSASKNKGWAQLNAAMRREQSGMLLSLVLAMIFMIIIEWNEKWKRTDQVITLHHKELGISVSAFCLGKGKCSFRLCVNLCSSSRSCYFQSAFTGQFSGKHSFFEPFCKHKLAIWQLLLGFPGPSRALTNLKFGIFHQELKDFVISRNLPSVQ